MFEDDLYSKALALIKKWEPKLEYSRETRYRDDLKNFLRGRLRKTNSFLGRGKKVKIVSEASRALADIGISREVGIELKRNLRSQSDVDRCVGQAVRYLKDYRRGIIVVLVGKTNRDKFEELMDSVKHISRRGGLLQGLEQRIWIEDKG